MEKLFHLSSTGLKNIITNNLNEENEFRFIFGDIEVKTNKFIAEFISPAVSHLHQSDPTINSMNISYIIPKNVTNLSEKIISFFTKDSVSKFEQIIESQSIEITDSDQIFFRILSIFLDNQEMYQQMQNFNPNYINEQQLDEVIKYIEILKDMNIRTIEYSDIIDRLSKDFSKIDKKKVQKIPNSILISIIENKNFDRKNEDELFDIISEIMDDEKSNESFNFYEEIDFKKLSSEKFRKFISEFNFNEMTSTIWNNLCECFYINHLIKPGENLREKLFEFNGNPENRLNGIIHHLLEKCKNVTSYKEIIETTSSSIFARDCMPENAIDFGSKSSHFCSDNESNQWIKFDFKDKRIRPNHYTIRTNYKTDICNPQNWNIEVSNTGIDDDWIVIDLRKNVTNIQKHNQIDTFKINYKFASDESYRFIRLKQTGKSSGESNYLMLSAFEVFGSLIEKY